MKSVFHQGELEMQQRAGSQDDAAKIRQMIKDEIPLGALGFLQQQSIIWIGIADHQNRIWVFPLMGSPGFIHSNNGKQLEIKIDTNKAIPDQWQNTLKQGEVIGCLVLELSSRRRLRINGIIKDIDQQRLKIDVLQAYPNCPKYIRKRELRGNSEQAQFHLISSGAGLDEQSRCIIQQADTAFVASLGPNGADVSHRGGQQGFIKCDSVKKITVPDYQGNGLFNTLGNFEINPVGGILIVDFSHSYFLQMTGKISFIFDTEYPDFITGGTNRYWQMEIEQYQLFQLQPNIKCEDFEYSPYNPIKI